MKATQTNRDTSNSGQLSPSQLRRAGKKTVHVGHSQREKANYIIVKVVNKEYTKRGKLIETARTFMTNVVDEMALFLRAIEPANPNDGEKYLQIVSEPSKWLGGAKNDQRYFEVQRCLELIAEKENEGLEVRRAQ